MNQLNDNDKKIAGIVVGGIALLVSVLFMWNNYQKYQQEYQSQERTRKLCESLKGLRKDVTDRVQKGEKVSSTEAAGAYRIGLMTNGLNCKPAKPEDIWKFE